MLINPTEAELIHAIAEHPHGLLDAMAAIPGADFHQERTLTWYTTPIVSPMFAGVMRIKLTSENADQEVACVNQALQASGAPFAFWWTGPESSPPDIGQSLIRQGVAPWDIDAPGMAIEIDRMTSETPTGNVKIEFVDSMSKLVDWKRAFIAGMEVPEFAGQAWVDATSQIGIDQAKWRLLVAYLDEDPVAVAGVIGVEGVASVFAVATAPFARRKGIGGAITAAGLRLLRDEGYRWGALFSTELGEPVYRRLGFRTYCSISRYLWRNPGEQTTFFAESE